MLKVVPLKTHDLKDVPNSLRRLSSMIDAGEVPKAEHAIVVTTDSFGNMCIYGYGAVGNTAHEVGVLSMAAIKLSIIRNEE